MKSGTYAVQYSAEEAEDMGLVNTVVPLEKLEEETTNGVTEMLLKHQRTTLPKKHPSTLTQTACRTATNGRRRNTTLLHN